ncbi:MAG TPA: MFS transporter [Bacillales bacterium]|nr:MFS transporter [Bacillales bacterium]
MNKELLKLKPYMFLLSAQTVSNLGDWLNILALLALVGLKWHASALAVSGVMLCMTVPSIIFGSFAGTIADRYDRKTLMIISDILRAITVIGVVFSTDLWQVYVLLCLKSVLSALFEPSKEGKLKEIVSNDLMQSAVSTSELVNNGAKIIGPVLSGIFIAAVGIQWSFYLDSLSFILSAVLLLGVTRTTNKRLDTSSSVVKKQSFFSQFSAGFSFLKRSRKLLIGLIVFSFAILFVQIADSQFIVLLRVIPGEPINLLGYGMTGSGAGVIAAAVWLNQTEIRSFLRTLSLSIMFLGVSFILIALLVHLPLFWIMILFPLLGFFMGVSIGMVVIPFNVMVQKETPETKTGRVFGTVNSASTLAAVIGMILGGVLSELIGVILAFIIGGAFLAAAGLFVYIGRSRLEGGKANAKSQSGAHREAQG